MTINAKISAGTAHDLVDAGPCRFVGRKLLPQHTPKTKGDWMVPFDVPVEAAVTTLLRSLLGRGFRLDLVVEFFLRQLTDGGLRKRLADFHV